MNATKTYAAAQNSDILSLLDLTLYRFDDEYLPLLCYTTVLFAFYLTGLLASNSRLKHDSGWIASIGLLINWRTAIYFVKRLLPNEAFTYAAFVFAAQTIYASSLSRSHRESEHVDGAVEPGYQSFLRPIIFPCETTHTRLFPEKHSFAYSYLFVGIPILLHKPGDAAQSDVPSSSSCQQVTNWFSVHAEDYLERGTHSYGFRGKLREYLEQQRADSREFPFAYLVTAPRFLGFSFNPVSFWYLFDNDRHFKAMILEVNNTFDERRMYFMRRKVTEKAEDDGYNFRNSWDKDFHVSPFNDRDGSYSVTAIDPCQSNGTRNPKIDNTIVLLSPERKAKIVARIFSTETSQVADKMSQIQTLIFVLRWWWVGFMTNPRILREARILWWKKKLKLFFRPEVIRSSIGRTETKEETNLETFFRRFLHRLSNESKIHFEYIPAAGPGRAKPISISPDQENAIQVEQKGSIPIEIKILTPAFYSELVRSKSLNNVFERYCFDAVPGEAMANTSDPESLRRLMVNTVPFPLLNTLQSYTGLLNRLIKDKAWLWRLQNRQQKDISFDAWTRDVSCGADISAYDAVAFKILLADRLALGSTALLKFYVTCIWFWLCFGIAGEMHNIIPTSGLDVRFTNVISLLWRFMLMHACSRFATA